MPKDKKKSSEVSEGSHGIKYVTLRGEGTAEYIDRKSRFIGYAKHIESDKEAAEFIAEIRKKHADARHNVYAYVTGGGNVTGYSDDGEPQGTAGLPVLDVIRKGGFTDAVIVVTRYFGGILLGTGGLVRAYTAAARDAANAAGITLYTEFQMMEFSVDYSFYQKIPTIFKIYDAIEESAEFADNVKVKASIAKERANELSDAVFSASSGTCRAIKGEVVLRPKQYLS